MKLTTPNPRARIAEWQHGEWASTSMPAGKENTPLSVATAAKYFRCSRSALPLTLQDLSRILSPQNPSLASAKFVTHKVLSFTTGHRSAFFKPKLSAGQPPTSAPSAMLAGTKK
jgi:hypothetical protein